MSSVSEYFGCDVFDSRAMKSVLSADVYNKLSETINEGKQLDRSIANEVASAMKNWAISRGVTHYTHWFQPMTGITAEKHDSFLHPGGDGSVIMEFSSHELIQGEPDASSFPSGGLRATFEARGYTTWDPTSYAFVKDNTLYIPTAFCSYSGEALDKKTPLLRSMDALSAQAVRILRILGNTTVRQVLPMVGTEQEYFLIDKDVYEQRPDLVTCGRTLFGAPPLKGQDMDNHYCGSINPRVKAFMEELDVTLWKLGIPAKTEHNETAPSQHELAPVYERCNLACDHNQLTMELMKRIALKHNLVCLLHEKPFALINGSGKHNNWSLATNDKTNLLSPGKTPYDNLQFLLFLVAVIQAADDYQDLLRLSVATAGNDLRLGASEAPPAIISVFLGDELTSILEAIEQDTQYDMAELRNLKLGAATLPSCSQDSTDRNRTSALAFTGNKFEFRMLGSSNSIACANIMLNAAVADTLRIFADELESCEDLSQGIRDLIRRTFSRHKRIVFNGNGYDSSWVEEATGRGLLNLPATPDCMPYLTAQKNIDMLTRMRVFSEAELRSRQEIQLELYSTAICTEAKTMADLAIRQILPGLFSYLRDVSATGNAIRMTNPELPHSCENRLVSSLSCLCEEISEKTDILQDLLEEVLALGAEPRARAICDKILPAMDDLRRCCDQAEKLCSSRCWPLPGYDCLLFSIR